MHFWIVNLCLVFFLCVFFAGIVIPQILLIAFRRRLFDEPDDRKIHRCVVPRLGGIAFKPVVFFSVAMVLGVNLALGNGEILAEMTDDVQALAFGFCTLMVLYLVGMHTGYLSGLQADQHVQPAHRDATGGAGSIF